VSNLDYEKRAAFLAAMANEERVKILDLLSHDQISVGLLAEKIGLSQSALSQHLAKLRAAKMVKTRREAQTIYYTVASDEVRMMLETLREIFETSEAEQLAEPLAVAS
jgi:ArsR family transcriptional regulator, virulence genes transcriptional regulator